MKAAMLKEFGHFDPEFVRVISYVALPEYIRWARCLADVRRKACLRTSSVGHSMFTSLYLIGPMVKSS